MSTEAHLAKSTSSANTTPTLSPTITLGFVALQRATIEHVGETRGTRTRRAARLVPIRVRSIAAAEAFVPLAEEITLSADVELVDVTFRPVRGADVVLPEDRRSNAIEFTPDRIPAFGLVRTEKGKLVLIAVDEELALPADYELVGAVTAPVGTFALDVYDKKTDEMYRLGYVFPNTIQPDWIQLVLDRRERVLGEREEERREREADRRSELEAEQEEEKARREREAAKNRPVRTFQTSDREVVRQMHEEYAGRYRVVSVSEHASTVGPDGRGEIIYRVADSENLGPAIADRVAAKREELGAGADAYFEREREAREYAQSLQK